MNSLFKNLSLYWRCQLLGWTIFTVVVYIFDIVIYRDYLVFIPFAISIFIFGLLFSQLLKAVIKSLGILKKSFAAQVLLLAGITILFSLVGTTIWMKVMNMAGIWEIDPAKERNSSFIRQYFFNLFPVSLTFSGWTLIYFLFHYVRGVRKEEQLRTQYRLQMIELEAKALRAQMNPHFIFNCLNSIKTLIQDNQQEKSVIYLTTFSKLIRTLFNNADKKEITLHDELETCKLYLQLESMRFDSKFSYSVNETGIVDLKSVHVPALIVQPFIENAIWHGIIPKNATGHIDVSVANNNNRINIVIDDNGIGRQASQQSKMGSSRSHESKGVHLTQSRLELNNLLQKKNARLQIIDKIDEQQIPQGTKVILTFEQAN